MSAIAVPHPLAIVEETEDVEMALLVLEQFEQLGRILPTADDDRPPPQAMRPRQVFDGACLDEPR
jgi:hypothetical protein